MKRTRLRSDREKLKEWKERSRRNNPLGRRTELRRTNPGRRRKRRERDFGTKAAWIRSLPCLVCGRTPSDPHHYPTRAAGGTSKHLTPLCRTHHQEWHSRGPETWAREHGIDLIADAERLDRKWEERG